MPCCVRQISSPPRIIGTPCDSSKVAIKLRFWRGDSGIVSELATRLAGSNDLYARSGRRPYASINFITAHDGFTLHDLVSYSEKHNEANGEHNQDGADDNQSWNHGAEGETDDPAIIALRDRQMRNLLSTDRKSVV